MPDALRSFLPLILCLSCCWTASAQPAPSTIEGSHVSARTLDAERAAADAYGREVAEGLLQGQARPDRCPQQAKATRCLLAARLLLVSRDRSSDEPSEEPAARVLRSRIAGLARDAAARDPLDPQLKWTLAKGVFREFAPELQAPAIEALRTREPDNLQVWLLAAELDTWDAERLKAAAASTRSDSYRYDFMRSDLELLAPFAVSTPALSRIDWQATGIETQQVYLIGVATAEWMPGDQGVLQACRTSAENNASEQLQACWQIAELLVERSDSLMDLGVGSALMGSVATTPAQRERADSARREYAWLGGISVELQQAPGGARDHLRRLRGPGANELSAVREAMREAGLPVLPPGRKTNAAK
jgi:hypothetical protein